MNRDKQIIAKLKVKNSLQHEVIELFLAGESKGINPLLVKIAKLKQELTQIESMPETELIVPNEEEVNIWANNEYGCSGTQAILCRREVNIARTSINWAISEIKKLNK